MRLDDRHVGDSGSRLVVGDTGIDASVINVRSNTELRVSVRGELGTEDMLKSEG